MNRIELQNEIIKKVLADESFRGEFLNDPKGTAEKVFGINFPDGMGLNVVVEDTNTISIILPQNAKELSNGNPEKVMGWCVDCHNLFIP